MIHDALHVHQDLALDEAHFHGTLALLQPADVTFLDFIRRYRHQLPQREHPPDPGCIVAQECLHCQINAFLHCGAHHRQFVPGLQGEVLLLLVHRPGQLRDFQGIVADGFKITNGLQALGDGTGLIFADGHGHDRHQIFPQLVFVFVQCLFQMLHLPVAFIGIVFQQTDRPVHILPGFFRHAVHDFHGPFIGQFRVLQQPGIQFLEIRLIFLFRGAHRQQKHDQRADAPDRRQHQRHGDEPVQGVGGGDGERVHDHGVQAQDPCHFQRIVDQCPQQHAQDGNHQVGQTGPLPRPAGAHGCQQYREGSANADAHDHGKGPLKCNGTGGGQRLNHTHSGGTGLQHRGKGNAEKPRQQRIVQRHHGVDEHRVGPQWCHGSGHHGHAGHQHGKAQQDRPGTLEHIFLGEHMQQHAGHCHRCRNRGAGEIGSPAGAFHIGKRHDPAGNARADVGPQDHRNGLGEFHHAGIHKADDHHRGCTGGLHGTGDRGSQQKSLQRGVGEFVQDHLHFVSGHFLQAIGHGRHSEEEQRHARQQTEDH